MSAISDENPIHIDPVDVNLVQKENVKKYEISVDSGISTNDSSSVTQPSSLLGDVLNSESLKTEVLVDLEDDTEKVVELCLSPSLSSPASISQDTKDITDNSMNLDELPSENNDLISNNIENISENDAIKENVDEIISNDNVPHTTSPEEEANDKNDHQNTFELVQEGNSTTIFQIKNSNDENIINRHLAISSASLNEEHITDSNNTMSKISYSRSAENISRIEQNVPENLNSSNKELNTEAVLHQFQNQKSKAAATQKITPEIPKNIPSNTDMKYARLPKELLPQDLGSLVKNVHGIFSSVSGSLKYAYNQTHRGPKPQIKNIQKPVPNGKIMDDIFEDNVESSQENSTQNVTVDKLSVTSNMQSESKKDEFIVKVEEAREGENDSAKDILKLQIESLERVLAEQRKENASLRERVKQQVDELQEKDQTFKDLEVKLDLMSKRVEQAEREKDAAVMRYASVECAGIEARRAAERAQAAQRAAAAEQELLAAKLKSAHSEKARICQLYDDKCHELANSEKELAKVREEVKELEGRLKWTQSKLRMEIDAYKDRADRAEKLEKQVAELEVAKETAAANATDTARAKQLEQELKETQAALILCRHEKAELEKRLASTSSALDSCKKERDNASASLSTALAEVEKLKENNLRLEEEAAELAALRAQAALADTLSAQLQRETERAAQAEECLSRERARAETCARREAAALEHAAKLTAQHVQHRAASSDHEHKAQALALDNASLRERITSLEEEVSRLQHSLTEETDRRNRETRALARKVAELTEEVSEANKKLEWEQGENGVLKKKHANAIKELNRELQRALKRCEQLEAKLPHTDAASTRTGSVSSLSSGESATPTHAEERLQNGHCDTLPEIQVREPDRQTLIERIVSLQRALARRAERCDFLEEHSRQLTAELRGKSKLLRHLLCSLPAGAVASSHSDAHKKEIARLGGGAMAAVWGGDTGGMTLELSLEMNTKLQAVLEDALLKNITLKVQCPRGQVARRQYICTGATEMDIKENLDTLGEEIARLKEQKCISSTKSPN